MKDIHSDKTEAHFHNFRIYPNFMTIFAVRVYNSGQAVVNFSIADFNNNARLERLLYEDTYLVGHLTKIYCDNFTGQFFFNIALFTER